MGFVHQGRDVSGGSPWVGVVLQVLFQVPQEMLLRKKESDTQRQQLPALWEIKENLFYHKASGVEIKLPLVFLACVRE